MLNRWLVSSLLWQTNPLLFFASVHSNQTLISLCMTVQLWPDAQPFSALTRAIDTNSNRHHRRSCVTASRAAKNIVTQPGGQESILTRIACLR